MFPARIASVAVFDVRSDITASYHGVAYYNIPWPASRREVRNVVLASSPEEGTKTARLLTLARLGSLQAELFAMSTCGVSKSPNASLADLGAHLRKW